MGLLSHSCPDLCCPAQGSIPINPLWPDCRMDSPESGQDERVVGLLTVRLLQAYHEGAGGCCLLVCSRWHL